MNLHIVTAETGFYEQTILLVEDSVDDVLLMRRAFQKSGVPNPLQVVGDGESAIRYLKGEPPYNDRRKFPLPVILLLDLNIPRRNGLEVLEWLRQQPKLRRINTCILSASSRQADVQQAIELGANGYVIKPSRIEALTEMVRIWHTFATYQAFPLP